MASWSQEALVEAPSRSRPRRAAPKKRGRAAARPKRVTSGAHWIVLGAILLAGVVALNVAVLQLNLRADSLGEQRTKLRAENAALASEISTAAANAQIQAQAAQRLGLVPADPAETTYVDLSR